MERVRIQNGNSALTRTVGAGGDTPISLDSGQRAVRILTTGIDAVCNALWRGGYGEMGVLSREKMKELASKSPPLTELAIFRCVSLSKGLPFG